MTRHALLLLLSLLVGGPAYGDADHVATFDAVWRIVDRSFYDDDLHGVDWEGLRDHYRPRVAGARSDAEARGLVSAMLAELRASHTAILDGDVYEGMIAELRNRRHQTLGLLLEESMPGRFFVRASFEGGPGDAAGIRVGDRVVAVDGVPIHESPALRGAGYDPGLPGPRLFFLAADEPLRLTVQSHPDSETRRTTRVEPARMNAVDAARNSVRVVEKDGLRIGTLHIWFCSLGVVDVVRDAVTGPLADCDALVLDIRGRGGYTDVVSQLLDLFRGERTLLQRFRGEAAKPLWAKPLVVLIDDRSRSAKEVFSEQVRNLKLGTLVGQRTEGAVLGATFHPLPDGSYLELASMAVPVRGKSLEGVGVAPDQEVDFVVPYSHGQDPILAKGLEVAVDKVRQARRDRRFRPL